MDQRTRAACVNSSHARRKYRNRRLAAVAFDPQPATGGFPYNLRSVAECDPLPQPRPKRVPREIKVAREYGYEADA